jgi:NIMA (never in mitosis gene a)-related kinase
MACLQKTFEGSNLPALVNKIMKVWALYDSNLLIGLLDICSNRVSTRSAVSMCHQGHFQPVPGGYSPGFRQLIHDLLQRDPAFRPSAAEILDFRLPKLLDSLREGGRDWFLEHDGSAPNLKASCNR